MAILVRIIKLRFFCKLIIILKIFPFFDFINESIRNLLVFILYDFINESIRNLLVFILYAFIIFS